MPACKETFRPYVEGEELDYKKFENAHPDFCCELETCSDYSVGCISDEEEIAFLLVDPGHFDEVTGVVTPDAFGELFRRDLSVIRTACSTEAEIDHTKELLIQRGRDRNPPQDRSVELVSVTSARNIRGVVLDEERALGLYDTALPEQNAHASVIARQAVISTKLNRKRIRQIFHSLMTGTIIGYGDYKLKVSGANSGVVGVT